ncbi:MAG TPA: zinc transporter ZupT [Clostridia bacterium]|jgi:ZIP family zinc transporter|nr:zinc transporter ZupT [Clostridiaceae bacterium]HOM33853.1 zinc transporter ZupT [Clostridia bacterium]HOT69927.1 zinc transporter ZupT [Clostridia bacterium]HQF99487.1 zinc transporter ZupT [Clostridia bacterium]HQH64719.1 zinc transporter ZupT [Clostridia bacterium]
MGNVWLAFGLTLIAGLSTGIGSLIAFFAKKTNTKFLSTSLGFSAGVMIYVSMVEIFSNASDVLTEVHGEKIGVLYTIIAFFGGMLFIALIDKLIPSEKNPHEVKMVETEDEEVNKDRLKRTGVLTALAIAIHNFPEGLATFVAALQEPRVAIPIVAAIAIHNIPEGIAVSVPIYYATGSKKKAFLYSFASGLSEPIGALIGYLILMPFMNDTVSGILNAAVAGIMVFISVDELLPSAREYGEHHLSIYGMVAGMAVMAISLWLFI